MREIQLTMGFSATVSDQDFDRVNAYKWRVAVRSNTRYAETGIDGRNVLLHRFLLDAGPEQEVDHRDGNGLNNTRDNIRLCSKSDNMRNMRMPRDNSSGFKGVDWDEGRKKWLARICVNGKTLHLGRFYTLEEAVLVYDEAARKHFGEFACLNLPQSGEQGCRPETRLPENYRRIARRVCTKAQTMWDKPLMRNNTSGFKGVSWYKRRRKWVGYIDYNGKRFQNGYFADAEDAARAYDAKARELFGEYACLNFPREGERGCRPESTELLIRPAGTGVI